VAWLLGSNIDEVGWPVVKLILWSIEDKNQQKCCAWSRIFWRSINYKSYSLLNDRFDTGFHVFGIEWGPKYINYYIDDVLYNQITPADVPGEWVLTILSISLLT
jgi:beta-glucanase (GH16 family)